MEEVMYDFKILTSKPTGKIPLGRQTRKWEDNIKTDLKLNESIYEKLH